MRLWSVKFSDREVFTHLQGEALDQARDKSINIGGDWEVWTHEINELPRGELLAACLNHSGWETHEKWASGRELLATFRSGRKMKS